MTNEDAVKELIRILTEKETISNNEETLLLKMIDAPDNKYKITITKEKDEFREMAKAILKTIRSKVSEDRLPDFLETLKDVLKPT